jgi:hypothetical protein
MTYQDRICEYIDRWAELDMLDGISNPDQGQRLRFTELCAEVADMIAVDKKRTDRSKAPMVGGRSDHDRLAMEAIDEITHKVRGIRQVKIGHGADQVGELALCFWGLSGDLAERYARKHAENHPSS